MFKRRSSDRQQNDCQHERHHINQTGIKNKLHHQLLTTGSGYLSQADFLCTFNRLRGRKVDIIYPRNGKDKNTKQRNEPDRTGAAVHALFNSEIGLQVDLCDWLEIDRIFTFVVLLVAEMFSDKRGEFLFE